MPANSSSSTLTATRAGSSAAYSAAPRGVSSSATRSFLVFPSSPACTTTVCGRSQFSSQKTSAGGAACSALPGSPAISTVTVPVGTLSSLTVKLWDGLPPSCTVSPMSAFSDSLSPGVPPSSTVTVISSSGAPP